MTKRSSDGQTVQPGQEVLQNRVQLLAPPSTSSSSYSSSASPLMGAGPRTPSPSSDVEGDFDEDEPMPAADLYHTMSTVIAKSKAAPYDRRARVQCAPPLKRRPSFNVAPTSQCSTAASTPNTTPQLGPVRQPLAPVNGPRDVPVKLQFRELSEQELRERLGSAWTDITTGMGKEELIALVGELEDFCMLESMAPLKL